MDSDLEFELELKDSYDISATTTSEFSRQRRKDNRNRKDIANMMKNNNHNCQRNRNSGFKWNICTPGPELLIIR